jgi:regulator of sigma E protease
MAIISAGVAMNLVFAVLFATWAFRAGVPYIPTEIGGTVPGGPAWEAGLEPGSRIVQIGRTGRHSEALRFDWDLRNAGVGLAQANEDLPLLVRRAEDAREEWVSVRPVMLRLPRGSMPMIGVVPAHTLTIEALLPGSAAQQAMPPLKNGDRIVAVDGSAVRDAYELQKILAGAPDRPVTLAVERAPGKAGDTVAERIESVVLPQRLKRLGLVMQYGPITGIQPNSPAQRAGFREGDLLLNIAGQPLGDPMSLPSQLRQYYGQEVVIRVR